MMVWVTRVLEVLLNIVTNSFLIVSLFVLTLTLSISFSCLSIFLVCSTLVFGGLSITIAQSIYRRLFDKGGKNDRI